MVGYRGKHDRMLVALLEASVRQPWMSGCWGTCPACRPHSRFVPFQSCLNRTLVSTSTSIGQTASLTAYALLLPLKIESPVETIEHRGGLLNERTLVFQSINCQTHFSEYK